MSNILNVILPIRSQSQRVKNKNIRLIHNKPLYSYIIQTLKQCKTINKIVINTDYEIIHQEFKDDPQVILMERAEHLKSNCNMNLVIENVLENIEGEYFLQTHATNPLLQPRTVDKGVESFFECVKSHDSLFGVTKVQKRFWSTKGEPLNHNLTDEPTTQFLEPYFEENSCMYVFSRESFFKNHNRIGMHPLLFEIPKNEAWDIDEEDDMQLVIKLIGD